MSEKILFVDDDPNLLEAFRRTLRKQFTVETAQDGESALAAVAQHGPYAVVVSDMKMPGMNGIRFLAEVRRLAPSTVRMLLTGHTDLDGAIEAINEGHIYRFLTKPCAPETLIRTLSAGLEQYRLITAEKELLEKTLQGSVKVLTDLLSIVSPSAFGRASRVRRLVRELAAQLDITSTWELEIAAMLSQIGCLTLPEEALEKTFRGRDLSPAELKIFQDHPKVGHDLIVNIPRLETVASIIAYQNTRYDGSGALEDGLSGEAIPLGARILKVALDLDTLTSRGRSPADALAKMRFRTGWYDPVVLSALVTVLKARIRWELKTVSVDELTAKMILAEEVHSVSGLLLIARGQEVTPSLQIRLRTLRRYGALRETLKVLVPEGA
jgi:response regulator RpfG family c-di-GMP phosphodiesterase